MPQTCPGGEMMGVIMKCLDLKDEEVGGGRDGSGDR